MAGFLYLTILPEEFIIKKDDFKKEVVQQAQDQTEALAFMILTRVISRF